MKSTTNNCILSVIFGLVYLINQMVGFFITKSLKASILSYIGQYIKEYKWKK